MRKYEESLLKTRALHRKETPYQLLETIRVEADGSVPLLEMHLERLLQSAAQLGFEAEASEIRTGIQAEASRAREVSKLRLLLHANGELSLQMISLPQSSLSMTFRVDSEATPSDHPELRHKTTRRTVYTQARKRVPDTDETQLINERGELMEFSIGNLLLRIRDRWLTPPLESGPLSGIRRRRELSGPQVQEQILTLAELEQADEIFLTNAVRGRVPMQWLREPTKRFIRIPAELPSIPSLASGPRLSYRLQSAPGILVGAGHLTPTRKQPRRSIAGGVDSGGT